MMNAHILDDTDKKILKFLVENTRMPFTEIASRLGISAGTVHVRVKKLEEAGIILGSSLVINYQNLQYNFVTYIGILLTKSNKTNQVVEILQSMPNITELSVTSGKYNIFCKIRAKDTDDAKNIIYAINDIDGVMRTESMISMQEHFSDKNRLIRAIVSS